MYLNDASNDAAIHTISAVNQHGIETTENKNVGAINMSALEGVRVIDLTEALAGPYCTMILGDLGADVVKIERPEVGDQSRKWGPPFIGTESAYFLSVNRNKRSVVLDIKSPEGRDNMRHLLEGADVFICNVRQLESLREAELDPETVRAYNPRLIYCSITAYGRTGPYAGRGGYDLVAQGEAGLMAATGEVNGEPMRWPVAIADLSCGLWSSTAILAALYARERTGQGQFIDQALLDSQLSWASVMAGQYLASQELSPRLGNRHANIVPYEVFRAEDKHLIVAVGTQGHWQRFCRALDLDDSIRDDPRFVTNAERLRNREQLASLLQSIFAQQEADHWLESLRAANIPCGPINTLGETLDDPQVNHRGMIVEFEHPMGSIRVLGNPLHLSGTPVTYRRRPPQLGEHTDEVLEETNNARRALGSSTRSGKPQSSEARPPRYSVALAAVLEPNGRNSRATIINVSEGGCAIRWYGRPPRVGEELMITVVDHGSRISARAIVRWTSASDAMDKAAGLELIGEGDNVVSWGALVDNIMRSGVRAA